MQWDDHPNAGFTNGAPWLPVADDYPARNVAAQRRDPASMLSLYRRLIALRKAKPALAVGTYAPVPAEGDVLAYKREHDGRRLLVALNLGSEPETLDVSDRLGYALLRTHCDRTGKSVDAPVHLRADEGVIVEAA